MSNRKQLYYQTSAFEMKLVLPSLSHYCMDPHYYSSPSSLLVLLFQVKQSLQGKKKPSMSELVKNYKVDDIFKKLNIHRYLHQKQEAQLAPPVLLLSCKKLVA